MKQIISMIIVTIIFTLSTPNVIASQINEYHDGVVKATYFKGSNYELESDLFFEMLRNPEIDLYDVLPIRESYRVYNIYGNEYIERTYWNPLGNRVVLIEANETGWPNWRLAGDLIGILSPETINFLGNIENIDNILKQNEINCKVIDYVIFALYSEPATIWVKTNAGVYYITFENIEAGSDQNHFKFEVFTPNDYEQMLFEPPKVGQVLLNGRAVNIDCDLTMDYNTAKINFEQMINLLGGNVKIDYENQLVLFTCGDKSYKWELNTGQLLASNNEYEFEWTGFKYRAEIEENKIFIYSDDGSLQEFANVFGKEVQIDYENLTINFVDISATSKNEISIYINNEKLNFDKAPFMQSDRVLVPMRAIFEALGADVSWNNDTQTATAAKNENEIRITIGENRIFKNGIEVSIDVGAQLIDDGWTFVPLRAVSEAFECEVTWNEETNSVVIQTNK